MSIAVNKREQVRSFLLRELRNGKYSAGSLFLSETTVSNRLGICKNTVREAFSALVGDGLLERMRGKGTFVRDVKAPLAAVRTVNVVIGDITQRHAEDPFIGGILTGLHQALEPHNWIIRLRTVPEVDHYDSELAEFLATMSPGESMLIAGLDCPRRITAMVQNAGMRLVTIGRPEDESIPFIHGDNRALTRAVVHDLIVRGHRRIALADHRMSHPVSFAERRTGYIDELSAVGITPDARLLIEYQERSNTAVAGEEVWSMLQKSDGYTALIVFGNWLAAGFATCAARAGVRIPSDVSVYLLGSAPFFTADMIFNRGYFLDTDSLGRLAGSFFLRLAAGEETQSLVLPPKLYPGNTVAEYMPSSISDALAISE